ncbi:MAG: putative S-adenosyl-L-methionine-dependent methyltransferase [Syntrophorhabdus sp. PtaU1.Bin058]|nr:MAG: putative S-adenosyl-L-methionine-dependent methyltransferase [Syntrophorhabdus sp. PtaU1.Bin058]
MEELRPSATAQRAAMKRAAHQLLDDPRVFNDPVALHIIGKEDSSALQAEPHRFEGSPLSPYLRAFVAARSRYAEDELAAGIRRGVCQYVILGAGLDTFAYRNPYPHDVLRVFEVDHPGTQAWKRTRLEEANIALPGSLTFAGVDFERQTLAEGLLDAGYEQGKCTFFSWLGATEYLSFEAVMRILRFIASMPAGSGVVFDYMLSPSLLTPAQRSRFDAIARHVASIGEPWHTFFDPGLLTGDLQAMGFGYAVDNGQEEINERYFKDRKDGLRVGSLSHIMCATV